MDRWTVIRDLAGQVLADFEAKAKRPAFTPQSGSHAVLSDIAIHCFELTVTPDEALDASRIGHLDDFFGITYWPELTPQRRDFTIAHEIAHRALGHPSRIEPDRSEDIDDLPLVSSLQGRDGIAPAYDSRDRFELEANVFAGELLAPIHLVRQKTMEHPDWTLEGLATYFGLSREAMANQLVAALLPGPNPQSDAVSMDLPVMDPEQEAAKTIRGNALILAGPGAGKTRVLTERFVHLVSEGADPKEILAITFANKAADEMRVRIAQRLPEHARDIQVATFHSLGLQLLTSFGDYIGLKTPIRVLTDIDAFVLLRNRLARLELGYFEDLGFPTRNLQTLLKAVEKAKQNLMGPEEYEAQLVAWQEHLAGLPEPMNHREIEARQAEEELVAKYADVARFYRQYQEWLREDGFVDYGDLLMEAVRLFDDANITGEVRNRYRYLLVDEFQDINYASGQLVLKLDGERGVTWAVGDPKQSIYRFQGASIHNIAAFQKIFQDSKIVPLSKNYRSLQDIVVASDAIAFPGQKEHGSIFPAAMEGTRSSSTREKCVRIVHPLTPEDASTWITSAVLTMKTQGRPLDDIAILCRGRDDAENISKLLEVEGIPTDWTGSLQSNPIFKDLMAVLMLAADDPRALPRLAAIEEHALPEADLRILVDAASRFRSVSAALYRARQGELSNLSEVGLARAEALLELYFKLFNRSTPWSMLATYLFELGRWPRELFHDETLDGLRIRATLGQIADLVRDFRHRGRIANGQGVKEFLQYIDLIIETRRLETATPMLPRDDVVHILTMHGSKGLQWPVVIMLVDEPWRGRGGDTLPLPSFLPREKNSLDNDDMEEASLFYVALTRAKDQVYLVSAKRNLWDKPARIHPILAQLRKVLAANNGCIVFDVDPGSLPERKSSTDVERGYEPFLLDEPIPHSWLETYADCGLKFLFQHIYGLQDSDRPFRVFTRELRRQMREVANAISQGNVPTNASIGESFSTAWIKRFGEEARNSLYIRRGVEVLLAFRDQRASTAEVVIGHEERFEIDGREVSLTIDELHRNGSDHTVFQHRFTRPSSRQRKDRFILALHLSQQNKIGMKATNAYYPLLKHHEPVSSPGRSEIEDYSQELCEAISAIENGLFPARPEPFKCRNCAFKLICPES